MQNKVLTFVITPISCVTYIFTAVLPFISTGISHSVYSLHHMRPDGL